MRMDITLFMTIIDEDAKTPPESKEEQVPPNEVKSIKEKAA